MSKVLAKDLNISDKNSPKLKHPWSKESVFTSFHVKNKFNKRKKKQKWIHLSRAWTILGFFVSQMNIQSIHAGHRTKKNQKNQKTYERNGIWAFWWTQLTAHNSRISSICSDIFELIRLSVVSDTLPHLSCRSSSDWRSLQLRTSNRRTLTNNKWNNIFGWRAFLH